jgi:hypothetical protein
MRFHSLLDALLATTVYLDNSLFINPEMPQYQALDWLANHDNYVDPEAMPGAIILERDVTFLFFTSNAGIWSPTMTNFLINKSVCDWGNRETGESLRGIACTEQGLVSVVNLCKYCLTPDSDTFHCQLLCLPHTWD